MTEVSHCEPDRALMDRQPWQVWWSAFGGDAFEHVAKDLGAFDVVVVELRDLEVGVGDELVDGAVEVAPARHPALQRGQPVLPVGHPHVGGTSVLEEVKGATRPQYPVDLPQGAVHLRDGAEGPGRQYVVDAAVVHGEVLTVDADVLDRDRTGGNPFGCQLAPDGGGVDRPDPRHARRVVGEVESRTEPDLQHLTLEVGGDAGP